MAVFITV